MTLQRGRVSKIKNPFYQEPSKAGKAVYDVRLTFGQMGVILESLEITEKLREVLLLIDPQITRRRLDLYREAYRVVSNWHDHAFQKEYGEANGMRGRRRK